MKKIFYISLLSMNIAAYAQYEKKVGINTNTPPKETLDVNGTMRIDDIGEATNNSVPLGWIPKTEGDDSAYHGKVVKKASENYTPMSYITYKINLTKRGSDYAREVNLKIDASKYIALLTQAYLMRTSFNFTNPSKHSAYVHVIAKKQNGDGRVVRINNEGTFVDEGGTSFPSSGTENGKYILGSVQPTTTLFTKQVDGKEYYFFRGDFVNSKPIFDHNPFSWIVNLIIIPK